MSDDFDIRCETCGEGFNLNEAHHCADFYASPRPDPTTPMTDPTTPDVCQSCGALPCDWTDPPVARPSLEPSDAMRDEIVMIIRGAFDDGSNTEYCGQVADDVIAALIDPTTPDALVQRLWKQRHELTPAQWQEAAPVLLGYCASLARPSLEPSVVELLDAAQAVQAKLDHEIEGVTYVEADRLRAAIAALQQGQR